ncbi:hypothetical protein INR49_024680 [Caranx melampygus]|nr:hypothetical protein INR49_024680 [Caranx melampygus]
MGWQGRMAQRLLIGTSRSWRCSSRHRRLPLASGVEGGGVINLTVVTLGGDFPPLGHLLLDGQVNG